MTNISVIVPSYRDWNFLSKLVESLYSAEAGCTFELVVIDDQSDNQTRQIMQKELYGYAHILRPDERAYFTKSCNLGLGWARENIGSDYYFLLNSDTLVTPCWGRALMETSVRMNAGIVGATLLYPDGKIQHAGAYGPGQHFGINAPWVRYKKDRMVPWVTGAALCLSSDALTRGGILPTKPFHTQYDASDRDYCTLATLNYNILVAVSANCIIYHFTHQSQAMREERGEVYPRVKTA